MNRPEQHRHDRLIRHISVMQERFDQGMLAELQPLSCWVVWKREADEAGNIHKVPFNPKEYKASIRKPQSWGTLTEAMQAFANGRYAGIGAMLTPPFVLIDLDHSYERATKTITSPQAKRVVSLLNSFTEASPNDGLHILVQASMPGRNIRTGNLEMYTNWFSTVTLRHLPHTPITVAERQGEIEALYAEFAPVTQGRIQNTGGVAEVRKSAPLTALPPEAERDSVLQRLLQGDITGYPSWSNADFVLIMKLLHWTGDDKILTRELFLRSPLGQRAKAERKTGSTTYVDMTIENVLKKRRNPPMRR
jgi:primase-polymerase (primpol)-like protein